MLKIKDGVDLKELEKFGFVKTLKDTYYKDEKNDTFGLETGIVINATNKKIDREVAYFSSTTNKEELDATSKIDTLFNLIKADLVEKV